MTLTDRARQLASEATNIRIDDNLESHRSAVPSRVERALFQFGAEVAQECSNANNRIGGNVDAIAAELRKAAEKAKI